MSGWNPHQQQIVDRVLSDLQWLIDREWLEAYVSARPYQRPPRRPSSKFVGDCTGTIKLVVCDWNGVPAFDGTPSGYGNTQSFFESKKCWHVPFDPKWWQPLDIVLYKSHSGPFHGGPGEHATILTQKKWGTWHCFSMGSTPGPNDRKWNYRSDAAAVIRFPIPAK